MSQPVRVKVPAPPSWRKITVQLLAFFGVPVYLHRDIVMENVDGWATVKTVGPIRLRFGHMPEIARG